MTPPPPPPPMAQVNYVCYMVDEKQNLIDLIHLCGENRKTCQDYQTQEEAQAAFNNKLPGTEYLDGDKDGKVCEWNKAMNHQ